LCYSLGLPEQAQGGQLKSNSCPGRLEANGVSWGDRDDDWDTSTSSSSVLWHPMISQDPMAVLSLWSLLQQDSPNRSCCKAEILMDR
jgi:hypothetical protein